jgi:hypothetical protein
MSDALDFFKNRIRKILDEGRRQTEQASKPFDPQVTLQKLLGISTSPTPQKQHPLGFPQTDIPFRTEELFSQGMPRNQAEVVALQEAELARKKELSVFPKTTPERVVKGSEWLKEELVPKKKRQWWEWFK